jgi:hypothetical protein
VELIKVAIIDSYNRVLRVMNYILVVVSVAYSTPYLDEDETLLEKLG